MSTEQERIDAHRAAVMAWATRIPSVLASPDAARALAFRVVGHLLAIFTVPTAAHVAMQDKLALVRKLLGEPLDLATKRSAANHVGSVLYVRDAPRWTWEARIPYEVCEALRRACEDEPLLCGGEPGEVRCKRCNGYADAGEVGEEDPGGVGPCEACAGRGRMPTAPPLLALLLHDAHALVTDLRADASGLERLIEDAEAREREHSTARPLRATVKAGPRWPRESEDR